MTRGLYGKVPTDTLNRIVFPFLGIETRDVVVGPGPGQDAAVLRLNDEFLVASVDPITAAEEDIGWLAVNISANDVAVSGARPRWFLSNILLPQRFDTKSLESVVEELHSAAERLEITVIGGHTEWTPELKKPLIVGTCLGLTHKYFASSTARPGDRIILTKGAGLEGAFVLASTLEDELIQKLGDSIVSQALALRESISVVDEAMALSPCEGLTAMHDPTESGLALGLHELSEASNVGIEVVESQIVLPEAVRRISEALGVDPLSLLSSGALMATVKPEYTEEALALLDPLDVHAQIIGEITRSSDCIIVKRDGSRASLPKPTSDEIWRFTQNLPAKGE
ncbi:MAG: AIR synthase family protein [Candidatus Geothermarchaeales archaeon]